MSRPLHVSVSSTAAKECDCLGAAHRLSRIGVEKPVTLAYSLGMSWFYLFIAGLCEIAWAIGLKYSQGLTRPLATGFTIVLMLLSFVLLALAMRHLPVGTAYAIWTGIGAAGTAVLGIVLFNEPRHAMRLACLALIVLGIIGLKWFTPAQS